MTYPVNEPEVRVKAAQPRDEGLHASSNLAILYEVVFTSVVRLQSSRQNIPDGESFRTRIKATLQEIEQVAASAGYDAADIRDTHFAIVALLDSVVLHSEGAIRGEWERKLLQEELFGQTNAGVVFFEKLSRLQSRRDSHQLADVLEVFLLCLLLGFEGRYSSGRGELDNIVEHTRRRIENIRGRGRPLSPDDVLAGEPQRDEPQPDKTTNRFPLIALAAIAFTILCFVLFKLNLVWTAEALRSKLP
jgi:type VI secretion system protein ImpK